MESKHRVFALLFVILVNVHSGYSDTKRMILKCYDAPFCIVANKNLTVDNCTWNSPNNGKLHRIRQQQVYVHELGLGEDAEDTSQEVRLPIPSGGKQKSYLLRVSQGMCISVNAKGMVGIGKCTLKNARLMVRQVPKDKVPNPIFNTPAYSLQTRFGECIGFDGNSASLMTTTTCELKAKNNQTKIVHNLWTFCFSDENNCTASPFLNAATKSLFGATTLFNATRLIRKHGIRGVPKVNETLANKTTITSGQGSVNKFPGVIIISIHVVLAFGIFRQ